MTSAVLRALPWLLVAGLVGVAARAEPAPAQAYAPGALQPVLLTEAYLADGGWLLLPPQRLDLLAASSDPASTRMAAYHDFESGMISRTRAIVGGPRTVEERRQAKRAMIAGIGSRLEKLPGAALFRHGERIWRTIDSATDFAFEGYRVRLRVDEAVEGKLALKLQKKLR